ncbi:hypothetical protein [Nocardia wallacei]|nr:hypothetical protein [Nocardia wallacei]
MTDSRANEHRNPAAAPATPANLPVPVIARPTVPQIGGLDR